MGYSHHPKATPFQLPNVPVPPPFASSDWTTSSPNVGPQRVSLAARRAELATGRSCGVFLGPQKPFKMLFLFSKTVLVLQGLNGRCM